VPFLLKRFFRKMQQRFTQYNNGFDDQELKREGEVNIDSVHEDHKKEHRPVDDEEYVDFEEIKENDPTNK
jgi:hypothetical protein